MPKEKPLPHVSKELLDHLETCFPTEVPSRALTHEEYLMLSGHKKVLEKLHWLHRQTNNKVL